MTKNKNQNTYSTHVNPDDLLKVMLSTPAPKKHKSKKKPKKK